MNLTYSILLIDNNPGQSLSLLETSTDKFDFLILEAKKLKEVKNSFENYGTILDLIILDLDFKDEDITGFDLLKDIKSKFLEIPVIILSDNYIKMGIESIVDAIKFGALDYIGKTGANPERLLLNFINVLEISNNKLQKRISRSNPFLTLCKFTDKNKKIYKTYFAYELNHIVRPKDDFEENEFTKAALLWHSDLYSVLSALKYKYSVIFRFSYLPSLNLNEKKINIYVIFSVEDIEESNNAVIVRKIFSEINLYFQSNYLNSGPVYFFRIMNKDEIKSLLIDPINKRMAINTYSIGPNDNSGDKILRAIENYDLVEKKVIYTITQDKFSLSSLQRTLEHIYAQENDLILDISLEKRELTPFQSSNIRDLKSIFNIKYFEENNSKFTEKLDTFANEPTRFFDLNICLFHNFIPENVSLSILKDLFANSSSVQVNEVKRKSVNLSFRDELNKELYDNNLFNVIHFNDLIKYCRIPLPSVKLHKGIENTFSSHYYKPHGISKTGPILGIKKTRYGEKVIRISVNDLKKHMYIIGQTGTGKTSMLFSMIMERIFNNEGVALIDPHGDFFKEVVNRIPKDRKKDLIIFDPTKKDNMQTINMLEYNKEFPEQKTFIIDEFIKIFDDLYDLRITGGPIFEQYMRNAMLLVMDDADDKNTLKDVVRVFDNPKLREELINKCKDSDVVDFWEEIALKAGGEASLTNLAPYITSKLNRFVQNHFLKNVIDSRKSTINFRDVMDNKKILLINLTKGKLGDVGVSFIGKIILNKIIMAAYSRENIPRKERVNFALFIDEFQNFTSKDLESAMSEARKYNLSLVFANQTLGQIDPAILESVLGNVGSLVLFRLGVLDAERLRDFYEPKLSKNEIINLPNYLNVSRLQINDVPSEPFVFNSLNKENFLKLKLTS